jgi:hypothetical protein
VSICLDVTCVSVHHLRKLRRLPGIVHMICVRSARERNELNLAQVVSSTAIVSIVTPWFRTPSRNNDLVKSFEIETPGYKLLELMFTHC